jgi:hypothetical protein
MYARGMHAREVRFVARDTETTEALTVVLLGTKSRASGCCEQTSGHIARIQNN